MLKLLRSLITRSPAPSSGGQTVEVLPPPEVIEVKGAAPFSVADHLIDASGFPLLDWQAAQQWADAMADETARALAWAGCERAWLAHLRVALGLAYQLREQGATLLLSTLEKGVAEAALAFVNKTQQRVLHVLDGVALVPEIGHIILIVFDDDEAYYRYVAHYYPEAGEFAGSGGMYIHAGCGHFVTVKADLRAIEPVVAHELTHACLGHLHIPAWLNEGIAVNTERRLSPPGGALSTPQQMHVRHQAFWGPVEIQQFWSGKSFLRADEGNELSYDLARILVEQFAADWDRFGPFVRSATAEDGGASAAADHLGVQLGAVVCALLEQAYTPQWEPDPAAWAGVPERVDTPMVLRRGKMPTAGPSRIWKP